MAQSSTVHAIGPAWSSENDSGSTPYRLHSPFVGLTPAMPQSAAGPRMEPPVSDPVPPRISPAATAAPVPDDEPAVKCAGFQGLRAGGQGRSKEGPPKANSCVA